MSEYPYPSHVVAAVADNLQREVYRQLNGQYGDFGGLDEEEAMEAAHAALQTLWEASRVHTLDELEELPKGTVLIDKDNSAVWLDGFYNHWEAANGSTFIPPEQVISDGAPLHIVHWGDANA